MGENVIMLLCVFPMPIIMMITGLVVWKLPAEYGGLGYSTPMSQKNQLTWKVAQLTAGKAFFFTFLAALPISVITQLMPMIFHLYEDAAAHFCLGITCAQTLALIIPITITERTLHRCFNKDGSLKE